MPKRHRNDEDLEGGFAVEAPRDTPGILEGGEEAPGEEAPASGAAAAPPDASLSKRARRKARAAAAAAAAASAPAVGAGGGGGGAPPAAAPAPKRLPPGAAAFHESHGAAQAAASLWAAFTGTPQFGALTALEYGSPLGVAHVVSRVAAGGLAGLPAAVKAVLPKWGALLGTRGAAAPRARGSPALLLLTHSAPRACDLIKALAPLGARVAKLFARHVPLADAAAALAGGPPVALAVGTPARVAALLERGALSLEQCAVVVLDAAPDRRGLCVLTEKEAREEWWALYWERGIHARVVRGDCKLALVF
jgi:hypothetical protein